MELIEKNLSDGATIHAFKLEIGKNYEGSMDSSFEILTIENELWIWPYGSCFGICEVKK